MANPSKAVLYGAVAALCAAAVVSRLGPERLKGPVPLAAAAGGTVDWAACASARCVTVYVAPWCGVCRSSTGFIKAFVAYMNARGVPARVVVGRAAPEEVAAYAADFGPGTLLDPSGSVPLAGGVPQFVVTSSDGLVLKRQPGVHRIVQPPVPEDDLRFLAHHLELL